MKKLIILILVTLLLCGCGQAANQPTQSPTTAPTQGNPNAAPDFTMYTKEGTAVKLSDLEGKPTILNFWASWCGPCKSEMPELEAAYKKYGDKINFAMVDLTDGKSETKEDASSYITSQGYTFPVYYDLDLAGAMAYGVSSIPFTIFINAKGEMVAYYKGAMDEKTLQNGINLLLPVKE